MERIGDQPFIDRLVGKPTGAPGGEGIARSIQRLATGLVVRGAETTGDSVELSENALGGSVAAAPLRSTPTGSAGPQGDALPTLRSTAHALGDVADILAELEGVVQALASIPNPTSAQRHAVQNQVDSILERLDQVGSQSQLTRLTALGGNDQYFVTDVVWPVQDFEVLSAPVAVDGHLDLDVNVTTSAQQGSLFMQFGSSHLSFGHGREFSFEIEGPDGSHTFTLASGVTLAEIAAVVNAHSDETGVHADSRFWTLRFASEDTGDTEFVSVRILSDGGYHGQSYTGIYRAQARNTGIIDTSTRIAFGSAEAAAGVTDDGSNWIATINGVAVSAEGRTLHAKSGELDVRLTLRPTSSSSPPTEFAAIRLRGVLAPAPSPGGDGGAPENGLYPIGLVRFLGRIEDETWGPGVHGLQDIWYGRAFNLGNGSVQGALAVIGAARDQVAAIQREPLEIPGFPGRIEPEAPEGEVESAGGADASGSAPNDAAPPGDVATIGEPALTKRTAEGDGGAGAEPRGDRGAVRGCGAVVGARLSVQ